MGKREKFQSGDTAVPMQINWQIGDLMEYRGKQELFTRQVTQRLSVLREHALVESAVSSNRIEGVNVDQKRIKTLVFGASSYRDRNEEEVAGYRKALNLIHSTGRDLQLSEENILKKLKEDGSVVCSGRGRGARWRYNRE